MNWQHAQQHYADRINQLLASHIAKLDNHAPHLKAAMEYGLLMGGKRVRPFLVYALGDACDVRQADLDVCAAAVECIHAYSLIHDDLPAMDDDDLRRGHPTCHKQFDEATAILAGDALQTLAFEILCHEPLSEHLETVRIELIRILSRASGYAGMCGGQAMDLASTDKQISFEQLKALHNKKTGALIKAALHMAAIVGQQTAQQIGIILQYADAIGLAFQVQDDILDVTADTQTLGKPQGSDEQANKSTYPSLLGLAKAQQQAQQLYQQALHALQTLPYNTDILQAFTAYIVQRDH
ncbi:(2E,6E)-farnesyl diphosphate synthase [Neptunicella marina]|uniref:(2E,6E)-farnesyl diphosphate synthase n=1 Tax=Neptunicella marina TaxID=2125989 RepID=A0A8J6IS21_9ALTE|nr:(2E,6E)-farnesyl diphosphate synthase [Neptunicella marina]MBC3764546.1 (2E,6E)-farnesyl diphosphate synthase [Neptunicella marina]